MLRSQLRLTRRDAASSWRRYQQTEAASRPARSTRKEGRTSGSGNNHIFSPPHAVSLLRLKGLRGAEMLASQAPRDIAEVYEFVRAVEERFGPLLEYRIARDFADPMRFSRKFKLTFKNPESVARLRQSVEFSIPRIPRKTPPEGAGLHAIQGLLEPRSSDLIYDRVEDALVAGERGESVLFRVQQVSNSYASISRYSRKYTPRMARVLLEWGGFAPLQPLEPGQKIEDVDAPQPQMRSSLQRWSEFCGKPYQPFTPGQLTPSKEPRRPRQRIETSTPTPEQSLEDTDADASPFHELATEKLPESSEQPLVSLLPLDSPEPKSEAQATPPSQSQAPPVAPMKTKQAPAPHRKVVVEEKDPARKQMAVQAKAVQQMLAQGKSLKQSAAKKAAEKGRTTQVKAKVQEKNSASADQQKVTSSEKVEEQDGTINKLKKTLFGFWS